jgi:replication factor A1
MIQMPLPEMVAKISEHSGLSHEEVDAKIKQKLDLLSGLISKEGAAHIIANELGVKLVQTEGVVPIKNILPGMRGIDVIGSVSRVYEVREFGTNDRRGKVGSVQLGDASGSIRLVFWNDQADTINTLKEGDVLKISSPMVKDNLGRKELHINTMTKVVVNPAGVKVTPQAARDRAVRKKLSELSDKDDNVEVFGTIVQVFDPRFFEVCPQCGKRAQRSDDGFSCAMHGSVKPDYGYVLNVFLDDGSSNMRVVLWRNAVQRLLGLTDDQVKSYRGKPGDFEKVKNDLLGNFVKFVGRVQKNEGFDNLEFVANLVYPRPDPQEELEHVKAQKPEKPEIKDDKVDELAAAVGDLPDDDVMDIDDLEDVE